MGEWAIAIHSQWWLLRSCQGALPWPALTRFNVRLESVEHHMHCTRKTAFVAAFPHCSPATMPPRLQAGRPDTDEQPPVQEQCSLLDLPESVLSAIAKHGLNNLAGQSMLPVARGLRDAVLGNLTKIKLDLQSRLSEEDPRCQSEGSLLHRACCKAPPGLAVELDLTKQHGALPQLLQPALAAGGWHNVHMLKVSCVAYAN
jgi:hypothetical protein